MASRMVVVNVIPAVLLAAGLVVLGFFLDALIVELLVFFLGVVLGIVLYPVMRFFRDRTGMPHNLAVAVTSVLALALIIGTLVLTVPPVVDQARNLQNIAERYVEDPESIKLLQEFPWLERYLTTEGARSTVENLVERTSSLGDLITGYSGRILTNIGHVFFVLLVALFTLAGARAVVRNLIRLTPARWRDATTASLRRIGHDMGVWGLANLGIALVTGVLNWLGYTLLGVENAILYGLLNVVGELIPTVGPILAGVVVVIATLVTTPEKVLLVIGVAVAAQLLLELVVPLVFAHTIKIHPLTIVLGILLLGTTFGLLGALLAVPLIAIGKILYEEFYLTQRSELDEQRVHEVMQDRPQTRQD